MLSIIVNLDLTWLSTYLNEKNFRSLTRCRSSNACFPTKPRAQNTLSAPGGEMASFARTVRWLMSHGTFLRAPRCFAAVIVAATPALLLARACNVATFAAKRPPSIQTKPRSL